MGVSVPMPEPLLKVVDVWKSFGTVMALKGVSFEMDRGEVVGLLGDNGAGKSTMAKIIAGVYQPDKGEIWFDGRKVRWNSPKEAREAGIEIVYQDLALIDLLSVARNFFLGREPVKKVGPFKFLDLKKMTLESLKKVREIGVKIRDSSVRVSALSGGERQAVAIARAVYFKAKLVILDEPTASLSVRETHKVLELVKELKNSGIGVIFITHNVYHVYEVADKFVILDRGVKIATYSKEEVSPEDIIETIRLGKPVKAAKQQEEAAAEA